MEVRGFTKAKPQPPVTAWLLGAVLALGLAALFLAAFEAFKTVMPVSQALFSALLIETAAVVEAVAFARDRKMVALAGLIVSLLVSGTYNYIQVSAAGQTSGIESGWQLITLAIGPLSALAMLSLSLGEILREHASKVAAWEVERQTWVDHERGKAQRRADRQRRQEGQPSGKLPESGRALPVNAGQDAARHAALVERCRGAFPDEGVFAKFERWDQLSEGQRIALAGFSGGDIEVLFPLVKERSARNWAAWAAELARGVRDGQAGANGHHDGPVG